MNMHTTFHAGTRSKWRAWLRKHHGSESEVWLVFHKRHTGRPNISYNDAVEEALCFGWIDSIIQKIDEERYARKFTPRKRGSKWSALNKRRIAGLMSEGRMTKAGAATITFQDDADDYGRTPQLRLRQVSPPPFMVQQLKKKHTAWENFQQLAPSYRRNYIAWISAAKTDKTRTSRLKEAVVLLSQNKKLGMK